MSRLDRVLLIAGAVVVLIVPLPFLLSGRWLPHVGGLLLTDAVGFGALFFVTGRALWRVHVARRHAERMEADAREAHRRLDRILSELATRRRGGPLS